MKNRSGFTLVELAVVITIIGLLVGAIMTTSSLTASARQQRAISDLSKYKEGAHLFYQKYYYWPGDVADATSRWSSTANGNGNGSLGDPGTSMTEYWYFWQHLRLADFIDGNYTGAAGSVPASPFEGGYITHYYDTGSIYNQAFLIGNSSNPASTSSLSTAWNLIKGRDAHHLDSKMDDGLPNSGTIRGSAGCVSGSYYTVSSTTNRCSVYYIYKN